MFTVSWDNNDKQVSSIAELKLLLDALQIYFQANDPTLVTITLGLEGDSLTIGLGRSDSILSFVRGDGNPPYLGSVGDSGDNDIVEFRFGDEWSEFSVRNAIPNRLARMAVEHFCRTGSLSKDVKWQEG